MAKRNEQKQPKTGGSFVRDKKTGELIRKGGTAPKPGRPALGMPGPPQVGNDGEGEGGDTK